MTSAITKSAVHDDYILLISLVVSNSERDVIAGHSSQSVVTNTCCSIDPIIYQNNGKGRRVLNAVLHFLACMWSSWRIVFVVPVLHLLLLLLLLLQLQLHVCFGLTTPPQQQQQQYLSSSYYASHWDHLLTTEYQENAAELRERRKTWSRTRLEENGISIFDAVANPDSEVLGEKMVRIWKEHSSSFRDRFSRGDVLLLTPTNVPGFVDPVPRECLVVDVGTDWLTLGVGASWPTGLWEARKVPGFYRVRLDRAAPQAPLRAQRAALDLVRRGKAGRAATKLCALFEMNSSSTTTTTMITTEDLDPSPNGLQVIPYYGESLLKKALANAMEATDFQPNPSQQEAVLWALGREISLIRGPPGTGKTRVAALLIATALGLSADDDGDTQKPRVLAVTHSNGAADVLLEALLHMGVPAVRVGRPASVSVNVQHRTVAAMAERMPHIVELRRQASDMTLDQHLRSAAAFELKQSMSDVQTLITKAAPVVVTSCIGAHQLLNVDESDNDVVQFPLVVLDEAAQTTEPALLCALAAAKAEQLVLVGDTQQLPPTITSTKLRDTLGISPMARLEKCRGHGVEEMTLRIQYRMPPALLKHPSEYFYNGLVTCADEVKSRKLALPTGFPWPSSEPLAFVETQGDDSEVIHSFGGRSNPTEANIVVDIVCSLLDGGDVNDSTIAVITPYSKQVQLIRSKLSMSRKTQNVRVGSVDSFQGQETDIVVFSAVRSNSIQELGFLRDSRRLCVATTRARMGLILVGDPRTLQSCRHWAALMESCQNRGCTMPASHLREEDESPVAVPTTVKKIVPDSDRMISIQDLFDELDDDLHGLFSMRE